ncbi:hypothetical protein [Clostridioides difficile]|uniref:hypothetical protein n=1 Tax=Clostridioides difficile TaxID=1496 RepID=UPI00097FE7D6|nr:hypothetical protein [Clostridioides difficile]EGT4206255.1 hypothetical protein [Clostridioides difficile]MCA0636473.1 hypothetical protein [Clostridioides difficile]MCI9908769.1 hypothetical protein [Clostridioides difficile]MCK8754307.1 hypothetical protein [Clostridioides difficile]MCO8869906.1 hypothetical protein [Clostridioides difficile]
MINLRNKEDLNSLSEYPKEIVDNVDNVINMLDESYSNSSEVTDNGGYVCVIEEIKEVEYLKVNILKGLDEEFSDVIYEGKADKYNSTLYLLSSDYAITVTTRYEATDELLK